MNPGVVVLVIALVVATIFGLWFRRANGRIRSTSPVRVVSADDPPAAIEPDIEADPVAAALAASLAGRLGEKGTMVQFSSAFCQPCRATRRILEEVTVMVPGIAHVEFDAEEHLDLVRALDIRRTPTVLFVDRLGVVRKRASGQPRKADVIAALGEFLAAPNTDFEI